MSPLTNITPFTYRDGTTYMEILEKFRVYVNETMRPEFVTEMDRIIDDFQAGIANVEARVVESETEYDALIADAKAYVDASVQFINNKTGQAQIQRVTLTGPYEVVIDPVWPNNHPIHVVLTQDATGGRVVTWDANQINGSVPVDTAPGAETEFSLVPEGDGSWTVVQYLTGTELDTAVTGINATIDTLETETTAALGLKANATSLATTNTNVTNLTTTVTGLGTSKQDKATAVTAGHPLRTVLGVIRNTGAGWQVLDDAGHTPTGIDSVVTTATHIEVNYTNLAVAEVGSFIAVPDDTLAQAGFFAGASVQLDKAIIKLGQSGKAFSDYISYNGSDWVSSNGVITATFAGGELTLTHPAILDEGNLAVTLAARMGPTKAYRAVISGASGAVQATSIRMQFRDDTDALVAVPDTNMRVYVSHGGGTRVVDPTTITTATYPNSNIWLLGMMKTA